ncbi:MAG: hypothetical protein SV760_07510, partial [Halobacteria archaeon]|nr:hypothetical protein [Halobacteria archaeon]
MGNRAEYRDDHVVVKGNARQRLYDPSGYGRPHDEGDGVDLSFVEAGYLLSKGKIESVEGDGFGSFVDRVSYDGFLPTYHVYSDLRERGYYLQHPPGEDAVLLYPRGEKPSESSYSDRIEVLDESCAFPATDLLNTDMFAVVDQEDDVTYFELSDWSEEGDTPVPEPGGPLGVGNLDVDFRDGVYVLRDYPDEIHRTAFYGTPFDDELRLSTVEAADLWSRGLFGKDVRRPDTSGREPEAEVYTRLRDRGLCPRTGFKFGT